MTPEHRQRLIAAHRIDIANNVVPLRGVRIDYASTTPSPRSTRGLVIDVSGGIFVLAVLVGATLAMLWLPGAH